MQRLNLMGAVVVLGVAMLACKLPGSGSKPVVQKTGVCHVSGPKGCSTSSSSISKALPSFHATMYSPSIPADGEKVRVDLIATDAAADAGVTNPVTSASWTAEVKKKLRSYRSDATFNKPANGWVPGAYRADFYYGDRKIGDVTFKID